MQLMKLSDLTSHDVFEFSYGSNYNIETFNTHWSVDSLYISEEDFIYLSRYIDTIIPNFNYMGPNKIDLKEWSAIKTAIKCSDNVSDEFIKSIYKIDDWLSLDSEKRNYFWILGI